MGKAKRFNNYDSDVEQQRKLVKSYGEMRQANSVTAFRTMAKSAPTATNTDNEAVVITSSTVADNSITFAKIQDIDTMKVIGRTATGSGDSSEISILDEDDMVSDSAVALATQQSIKAYVNSPKTQALDMNGNQIQKVTTLFLNGDIDNANFIAGNTGGLDYNVDDTDEHHDFAVDNVAKLRIGNTAINAYVALDITGNLTTSGELILTGSALPTSTNTSITSYTGDMNYNALTNDSHYFRINGDVEVEIDADGVDIRNGWLELEERNEPAAPTTDHLRIYAQELSGKTRLMVRFPTGFSQQIAIEP